MYNYANLKKLWHELGSDKLPSGGVTYGGGWVFMVYHSGRGINIWGLD